MILIAPYILFLDSSLDYAVFDICRIGFLLCVNGHILEHISLVFARALGEKRGLIVIFPFC